ncbi:MAG: ABC transporter ATP-binding protein, partial [Pseudomonadota bacterium]
MEPILSIRNLTVEIPTRHGIFKPVEGVTYDIFPGEIRGVVGESGAGKSMTGNAVIGLLDPPAHITGGEIWLKGRRIDNLSPEEKRLIRGKEIGMIFQDPLTSLNPLFTIGEQLVDTIQLHLDVSLTEAKQRALGLLEAVSIPNPKERFNQYPHQFSGGMRQRVVIALALCSEPSVIVADEPTTALDVSIQAQVLDLIKKLAVDRQIGVILITHDMGVIADTTEQVTVMYSGKVVESGTTDQILGSPQHEYTKSLISAVPRPHLKLHRFPQISYGGR